jgi:hypothetical protein
MVWHQHPFETLLVVTCSEVERQPVVLTGNKRVSGKAPGSFVTTFCLWENYSFPKAFISLKNLGSTS